MRLHKYIFVLLILIGSHGSQSQEVVKHLRHNPQKTLDILHDHKSEIKNTELPLSLPFWDDFSYPGPYPDAARWTDHYVYVNTGFAVHPKTVGVATFDILDEHGNIYEHIETGNIVFTADRLTSHPINLKDYNAGDSLVLSFYYQPQGRGGDPGRDERLVLQFLAPENHDPAKTMDDNKNKAGVRDEEDENWLDIWSAQGENLSAFSQDTFPYFKRVSIAITDDIYFRDDFQFRFLNRVAVPIGQVNNSGTRSIWNIDYVSLDAGRSVINAFYHDIAFAAPAQPLLRNYSTMPWSQYIADPEAALRERLNVVITNLSNNTFSYTYRYFITDESGSIIRNYSGGSWTIPPFVEEGYQAYAPHSNPLVIPNPLPTAPAVERQFEIVHAIRQGSEGDPRPANDTIKFKQSFSNYFAYDDGSPESVHLVKGQNPTRALRFNLAEQDILESVKIFFMATIDDQNIERPFELCIYSSLDPEVELYRSEEFLSLEEGDYRFISFKLDEPVVVENAFYIGITQIGNVNLENSLVIGFDLSNNVQDRLFINDGITADGEWYGSLAGGAIMIRPVMKRDDITGIDRPGAANPGITLYPNPVTNQLLNIHLDQDGWDTTNSQISIFNIQGKLVYSGRFSDVVDVSGLQNGLYLLRLTGQNQNHSARFLISR